MAALIEAMPKTYDTEEQKAEDKVVFLHYFTSGCDWWIIEKDEGVPGDRGSIKPSAGPTSASPQRQKGG